MPCTSAVTNTVLPARERPVTPSRIVGLNRLAPKPVMARAVIRASSRISVKLMAMGGGGLADWKTVSFQIGTAAASVKCRRHGCLRGLAHRQSIGAVGQATDSKADSVRSGAPGFEALLRVGTFSTACIGVPPRGGRVHATGR